MLIFEISTENQVQTVMEQWCGCDHQSETNRREEEIERQFCGGGLFKYYARKG